MTFDKKRNIMKWTSLLVVSLILAVTSTAQTNTAFNEQRMRNIIIPSIEFRDADPIDVLKFLVEASLAKDEEDQKTPCIGFLSTNTPTPKTIITYQLEDGTPLDLHPLTLEYRSISLYDAIDRMTSELGLTFRLDGDQLSFFTKDGRKLIRKEIVEPAAPVYPKPASRSEHENDW